MILVEGPNGGGKTTLVRHLADKHRLLIADMKRDLHRPPDTSPEGQRERVYTFLAQALMGNSPVRIVDRLYFSELVYGHLWRYKVAFTDQEQLMIEQVMEAMSIPVIFCIPPVSICRENVEGVESQHEKVLPTLDAIYGMYDNIALGRPDLVYRYDYTQGDEALEYIDTHVAAYLDFRKERSW